MKFFRPLCLSLFFLFTACGPAKDMPTFEGAPTFSTLPLLEGSDKLNISDLPLEGSAQSQELLWSGDHWPFNKGSINRRWNTPTQEGFNLVSPSREEVLTYTEEQLARLSPSEKYDLLMGHYDYPLKTEVETKANPLAVEWEGIGNGWALASVGHHEPTPKTLSNPDGVMIPFGSSDIKALLSYYYAFAHHLPPVKHLGLRCSLPMGDARTENECSNDLNAGSFHVVLANRIGLKKQSILADIDRYHEVWNHPIHAYRCQVLETILRPVDAPKGAMKALKFRTVVTYTDRSVGNTWGPVKGSYRQVNSTRVYNYVLYLNGKGDILNGEWTSGDRPDFIWVMPNVSHFDGQFAGLNQLVN